MRISGVELIVLVVEGLVRKRVIEGAREEWM